LNGETNVAPKIGGGLPMKPTTLSFLVGHLQKAPRFTATTAHITNAHQQRFFLAPPHSQPQQLHITKCAPRTLLPCSSPIHSVHLQQHLVATALNEIVISVI